MIFKVITLFPKMFESPFAESMIKRAIDKNIINLEIHNLRKWAIDNYGSIDDHPFGGGVGMLIRPEPVYNALKEVTNKKLQIPKLKKDKKNPVVLLTAGGKLFTQKKAEEMAKCDSITFVCGHYEGFDQRIHEHLVDEEISIGSYILTGGELPAMVIMDTITRLLPGVLGKYESNKSESYSQVEINGKKRRIKEYPQYTRPREFMGLCVPEALLSGNPKEIERWQVEKMLMKK